MRQILKPLLYSFLLTLIYFGISALYFFGTYFDVNSEGIRKLIDLVLTYPAMMYFGLGFSGHTNQSILLAELKIFIPIWASLFVVLFAIKKIRKLNEN